MFLIIDIGRALFSEVVQVAAGCLISVLLYRTVKNKVDKLNAGIASELLIMLAASICGVALPLGTYGVLPILITALAIGIKYYTVLPLFISNALFNSLVPFTYVGFAWRTGIYRVILAFIVGICAGIILKLLNIDKTGILRVNTIEHTYDNAGGFTAYLKFLNSYINTVGLYLILGVILDTIFLRYFFYSMMNTVNIGSIATTIFSHFKNYDITTPVFLLIMVIFYMLMNLKMFSGLLVLFKWKGILGYFVYFSIWAVTLAILNIVV